MPVMSFRLDEYSPCSDPTRKNISPNKVGEYVLMSERREYCANADPRSVLLDSIGEETLFRLNAALWAKVTQSLPSYPRPSDTFSWVLSYQQYPHWSFDCRSGDKYNLKLTRDHLLLTAIRDNRNHFIVTVSLCVFFAGCFLVIVELCRRKKLFLIDKNIENQVKDKSSHRHS